MVAEAKDGPMPKEVDMYVERYGREKAGFLSYPEFVKIYETFVVPNTKSKMMPTENRLNALFNLLDG